MLTHESFFKFCSNLKIESFKSTNFCFSESTIFFGAFFILSSHSKDPSRLLKTPSGSPIPAKGTALGTDPTIGNQSGVAHSSPRHRSLHSTPPADIHPVPTLRDAADALVEGRLNDALEVYQKLMLAFPEDESFALAVEILSRRRGVDRDG